MRVDDAGVIKISMLIALVAMTRHGRAIISMEEGIETASRSGDRSIDAKMIGPAHYFHAREENTRL